MKKLAITYVDPAKLNPNDWNPNVVDAINQDKLKKSLEVKGWRGVVSVKTLDDGSFEIIGGEHRVKAAVELGHDKIPIINYGTMSDAQAKEQLLLDNSRYGDDDPYKMSSLLHDDNLSSADELISMLPIDTEELAAFFEHDTADFQLSDLDDLDDDPIDLDPTSATSVQTHQIMRFKVPVEDAGVILEKIKTIKSTQGFTEADELSNAGDALIYLFRELETNNE